MTDQSGFRKAVATATTDEEEIEEEADDMTDRDSTHVD